MSRELIRIILVDDHQIIRQTWKMILEQDERFEIIAECSSGAEAISLAEELSPDIILMDVNMSPVNGFEATRKICRQFPDIRIIGISVNNQPGYAQNMMKLGAKGFMTKNSTREEMVTAIIEVYNGNQYICEEVRKRMK